MSRFGQVGIAVGTLGIMMVFMGLFPNITGLPDTVGIGVVQVVMLLLGYSLLLFGAIIYVKFTFFWGVEVNLSQQISLRLVLTGLLFGAIAGLSDILGFGSHLRTVESDIFFGPLQAFGILTSFGVSSFGVLLYVVSGDWREGYIPSLALQTGETLAISVDDMTTDEDENSDTVTSPIETNENDRGENNEDADE